MTQSFRIWKSVRDMEINKKTVLSDGIDALIQWKRPYYGRISKFIDDIDQSKFKIQNDKVSVKVLSMLNPVFILKQKLCNRRIGTIQLELIVLSNILWYDRSCRWKRRRTWWIAFVDFSPDAMKRLCSCINSPVTHIWYRNIFP